MESVAKLPKLTRNTKATTVTQHNLMNLRFAFASRVFRAFKMMNHEGMSPTYPTTKPILRCKIGATLVVRGANTSPSHCGAGVNVATMKWIKREFTQATKRPPRLYEIKFRANDVAAIPVGYPSNIPLGKFRLFRGTVTRRLPWGNYGKKPAVKRKQGKRK